MKIFSGYVCICAICFAFVSAGHAADDPLNPEERAWLSRHDGRIILGAEPDWPPVTFFDEHGDYQGISVEYVRLIERRLGFRFKIVKAKSFQEILDKARRKQIDVVMNVTPTPERSQYLMFTKPYLKIPSVILTRRNFAGPATLADLVGKEVAVPSGYSVIDYLKVNHPGLRLVYVPGSAEGLRRLSAGEYDAMILELPAASYLAEKEGITNLRVAGFTGHEYSMGIGSRKDLPMLNRILDKGLAMISPAERDSISLKWVHLEYQPFYRNRTFITVAVAGSGIMVLLFSAILIWSRTLKRQVQARTRDLQNELNRRQQAEARLRALVQTIPDLIWLKDADGVYLSCNRMFERFFGAKEADIIGKTDYDFLDKELADFFRERDRQAMAADKPIANEEWLTFPDDGYKGLFDTIKTPMYDAEGALIGVLGISHDITARTRAEEALRLSEGRYRNLYESMMDAYVYVDLDGRVVEFNEVYRKMLGYEPEELRGLAYLDLSPEKWHAVEAEIIENQALTRGYTDIYEKEYQRKDGTVFPIELRAYLVRDHQGVPAGLWGIVRDITERKRAEKELRDSEEKYRRLVESLGFEYFFYRHGVDGVFFYVSPSITNVLGYSPAEFLTHFAKFLTGNPLNADAVKKIELSMQGIQQPSYEVEACHKDGTGRLLEITETPLFDAEGRAVAVDGIAHDITVRKRAETALTESEELLRAIFNATADGVLVVDKEGRIIQTNQQCARMLRIPREILDTGDDRRVVDSILDQVEDPEGLLSRVRALHRSSREGLDEVRFKDGRVFERFTCPIVRDGEEYGRVWDFRDITARKLAEESMRLNVERVHALLKLNQMTDAAQQQITDYALEEAVNLTQSKIGYLAFLNADETIITMHSWSRQAMQACAVAVKPIEYIVKETGLWGEAVRQRRAVITNDYAAPNPWKKGCPDGHVKVIRHMNVPVFVGRHMVLVAGVGNKESDYTENDVQQLTLLMEGMWRLIEHKRDEAEKKRLEAQLVQAQKMESIGTLAGGIAHDFNNILSAVIGFTELAKMKIEGGQALGNELGEVLKAGIRARDLVRQILAFSRQSEIKREPTEIAPLIKEALKFIRASLPATIEIRQAISAPGSLVLADSTQVHQILMNLFTNAAHAMQGRPGVLDVGLNEIELADEVSLQYKQLSPGRYLQLSVTDTGGGIPREIMDRIFDPFFTTKKRGEGTGMGLAVVHGIVKEMGGNISVYSDEGKGTTFRILFPRFEGEQRAEPVPPDRAEGGGGRILFVDDEEGIIAAGREILVRLGYEVVARTSPLEALELFGSGPEAFDLVMTDMTMPGMTGLELSRRLLQIRPDIPIILCTGFSAELTQDAVRDVGIREMVMKPMIVSEMAGALSRALHPREDQA